ncbi:hypothetical protein OUZ56_027902 [Daphnia magna]|uniref:Uncharacterized protein n=1 Tax=Daphnia magna TaxID=35525 RepID=A0ABR0B2D8_9CRUS|nr:hypothetical protein OUZ56_027902 [Daphnia magna]
MEANDKNDVRYTIQIIANAHSQKTKLRFFGRERRGLITKLSLDRKDLSQQWSSISPVLLQKSSYQGLIFVLLQYGKITLLEYLT